LQGWGQPEDRTRVLELAQDAMELEPDDLATLRCAGHVLAFLGIMTAVWRCWRSGRNEEALSATSSNAWSSTKNIVEHTHRLI
jgi:hypothetical protein